MARKAKELSALEVGRLTATGHHAVGGVAGLYLYVVDSGARSWVLRTMVGSKRRHMGLGGFPEVSLAKAREKARTAKEQIDLVAMCGETTGSWHFAWNRWSRGSAPQAAASMPSPPSPWG